MEALYAVYMCMDDKKKLCSTYNPTHDMWMPAIFHNKEDAEGFYKSISSVKGFEMYKYVIDVVKL